MKTRLFIVLISSLGVWSCANKNEQLKTPAYTNNIEFNHLYVMIDEPTYDFLFDSLEVLNDFSNNYEQHVDAGDDEWTGKYLNGKQNYLEFFKPSGYAASKFGHVGLGFITNKLGTLDSLYGYWKTKYDSVDFASRYFHYGEDSMSWYNALSLPNIDSLRIEPWLMENTKEHMKLCGFTDNDLLGEIDYWDYNRYSLGIRRGIEPDSIKYEKLFDRVVSLYLTLSQEELNYLSLYLVDFGFNKKGKSFIKDDFDIQYSLTNSEHFLLNQIDFVLLDSVKYQKQSFRNIELVLNGNTASMKFNY